MEVERSHERAIIKKRVGRKEDGFEVVRLKERIKLEDVSFSERRHRCYPSFYSIRLRSAVSTNHQKESAVQLTFCLVPYKVKQNQQKLFKI